MWDLVVRLYKLCKYVNCCGETSPSLWTCWREQASKFYETLARKLYENFARKLYESLARKVYETLASRIYENLARKPYESLASHKKCKKT